MEEKSAYTDRNTIISLFEAKYVDILPDNLAAMNLIDTWLIAAIGQFEREVRPLNYDILTGNFKQDVSLGVMDIIAYMMKLYYLERELDRMNKKINIVGKDLSLNDTSNAKKMTYNELEYTREKVELLIDQEKQSAYGGLYE